MVGKTTGRLVLPGLAYLLVSLLATWPLITHLRGWVPGFGDWGQNLWALWWTRQSLLSLAQSPFYTTYLFNPEGITLLFHPLDVSDGLLALPIYGVAGGDISYNLIILLSFVLSGWGTYQLALYLTGQRLASFIAGLIFMLAPYHFLRIDLGHLNLSTMQWIPFYILFLLKYIRQNSKSSAALAVLFLVLNALNSWYYVVYCGLISMALILWPRERSLLPGGAPDGSTSRPYILSQIWHQTLRVAVVLGVAAVILLPLLLPMFRLLSQTTLIGAHDPLRHSVDLLSFWVPGPPSSWAAWFEDVWIAYAAQNREPGASAYLGYTVLGLAVVGVLGRRRRRPTLWWLAVAMGFSLLALGPQLQLDGRILPISLPYRWLSDLVPLFSITGIPGRFVVMTALALAMLAAYGAATIDAWLGRRREHSSVAGLRQPWIRPGLYIVIGLIISLEFLAVPMRLTSTQVNDIYPRLADDAEPYPILDIKWDANFLMHAQTVHGKPLVGGWLARLPADQAAYLNEDGLDRAFLHLLLGPDGADLSDYGLIQTAIRANLEERGVRYIIDHDHLTAPWLEQLIGWPIVYEENNITVYGNVP